MAGPRELEGSSLSPKSSVQMGLAVPAYLVCLWVSHETCPERALQPPIKARGILGVTGSGWPRNRSACGPLPMPCFL